MSVNYLRTMVRTGARPINPSRGDQQGRQAQGNIEPVAETTLHAFFAPRKAQRRFPPADGRQDPQEIHDHSAPAAEESAAQVGTAGEAVTSDGHRSVVPQDSVISKTFSVLSPLTPNREGTTRSSLPAVSNNGSSDFSGTPPFSKEAAKRDAALRRDALGGSTAPEPIADAPSVVLQVPGRAGRAEGQDRHDQEIPDAVVPPTSWQPLSTGVPKTVQRGRAQAAGSAQPGLGSPDRAIPPPSAVSEPRSSQPEGGPRSLHPQRAAQHTHTDLAVFYVTRGQAAPEAAGGPKVTPAETHSGNTFRTALLQPAVNSVNQPKAEIVGSKAGAEIAVQAMAPAAEGRRRPGEVRELESIASPSSAAKPKSVLPVLPSEVTQELTLREPLPARPREQAQLPPAAGMGPSQRDEGGLRLLIHRLDVQIVTQKQPELPRQIPPSQPAAVARDAWEGFDRHYLHRVSVSA